MARIVMNTYMVRYPLGGNLSWALQWIVGLRRLGHDVYVVEKSGYPNACFDLARGLMSDDCTYGVGIVRTVLARVGLQERWCYVDAHGEYHGLSCQRVEAVIASADLFLDMGTHGVDADGSWLDEAANAGLRVLVATEPGLTQMRMALKLATGQALPQYDIYYTTGLNVGTAASSAPTAGRRWRPILDPVVVELFACHPRPAQAPFTTVMNWQSMSPVTFEGVEYGQKDREFPKFIDLPRHTRVPLELAMAGRHAPTDQLRAAGWRIRDALQATVSVEAYLAYIAASQGEFGISKHACVATNVGWFSERSAAYLASGRPVVVQETGFSRHLPCGRGLFAVRTVEEAAAALDEIDADWQRHARWARELAREYLDARTVLGRMLEDLAVARP
ncbi:MAG TPA: hypothetical protein VGT00_11510 [Methylomirabilota bacterium]|jgi:hypothetical protein|nr:hypothetical protein [Methylomirabilota bacterium]